ncbi:hypothetical protein F2Q69_00019568 [Brassica cretica]|uniref:Phospholipase D C-terminal domain-containing protein n=1 Tax=Brassica cretica TaxID=69181 RepID=A0A8S9QGQ7_BRACR|nr:hypothetical protein F2Q69_00019568 [Brassica cretica]
MRMIQRLGMLSSVKGFPKDPKEASGRGQELVTKRGARRGTVDSINGGEKEDEPEKKRLSEASSSNENDPETWHAQVFRSIDSSSVKGFPKDPKEASGRNLLCGKNILIDMSIHAAYVKAIRSAQHFIYIVNQYFLGSSFNWDSNKDLGANNLIPIEMALKIANKIRAREKFAAYIVIPMWPEGAPTRAQYKLESALGMGSRAERAGVGGPLAVGRRGVTRELRKPERAN